MFSLHERRNLEHFSVTNIPLQSNRLNEESVFSEDLELVFQVDFPLCWLDFSSKLRGLFWGFVALCPLIS